MASEWAIDDQTMTASVSGVHGNSGLNVWVCDLPGFIPCSLLRKRYRETMSELIGTEITCKLIEVDELRRNFIFCPLELDDGGYQSHATEPAVGSVLKSMHLAPAR